MDGKILTQIAFGCWQEIPLSSAPSSTWVDNQGNLQGRVVRAQKTKR